MWIAGPLDLALRSLTGRRDLAPLWLRRQAGPLPRYESSAREMAAWVERLGVLDRSDSVLDVGCGAGAMVPWFERMLGPDGRYVGFDVHRASIRWCRKRFTSDSCFRFELAEIASPYGSRSGRPVEEYRFPIADGQAGFILAKSVFTHLLEPEARHYLSEIWRSLRPGRAAVITAFLFEKGSRAGLGRSPLFALADERSLVRWRSKARPLRAVAYERAHFLRMIEEAELRVQWICQGFLPGDTHPPSGQDILLLGR